MQTHCVRTNVMRRGAQRGGVLLIMAASILALAASTLVIRQASNSAVPLTQQALTQQRMAHVHQALKAYWAAHACSAPEPADGAVADDAAAAGVSSAATPAANRVVPWRTLGLRSDDALDGWGRRLTYQQDATFAQTRVDTTGDGVAEVIDARWVLVSHGPSGLGGWVPTRGQAAVQQAPWPPVSVNEQRNLQGPVFVQVDVNARSDMNPATDPAFFDDVVSFVRTGELVTCAGGGGGAVVGAPTALSLNSTVLKPPLITFTRRGSGTNSVTINGGALGHVSITSAGGQISANSLNSGTAVGVCSNKCNNRTQAAMNSSESLAFKLVDNKTAGKVAIGLLGTARRATTVGVSLLFKRLGVVVSGPRILSALVSRNLPASPQLTDVMPVPAVAFDEVVIQPVGSALFLVSSIRFCAASATCN
jgi:hypothetical protein